MYFLGIDVGTTGIKAALFNETGHMIQSGFKECDVDFDIPERAQQDAERVWLITKDVISQAAAGFGQDVAALCVSVQGDAVIPIDSSRHALSPAQLGMDYRGRKESSLCAELFGARELFERTGMRSHPLNSFVKMLWIKNNAPDLYDKTTKFVTYSDFIMAKLGSEDIVIDNTMATRTMCMDISSLQWSDDILKKFFFDKSKLSRPISSGSIVGEISNALAQELGITPRCKIVAGGHDQPCAALGAGVIHPDMALDSHGTAEVVSATFLSPCLNDVMYQSFYPCYAHTVPGQYFTFALIHIGGILLKWFADNFCANEIAAAAKTSESVYKIMEGEMPSHPSPITVIPYFNGSGTPTCDLDAKGSILGLTMSTGRGDIAKAIIEALCFEMRTNIETMQRAGISIAGLRCVGGGARSPLCLQTKADVTGLPISTLKVREAACFGAALLASTAMGAYSNIPEAVSAVVRTADLYTPSSATSKIYEEKYQRYKELSRVAMHLY